MFFRRIDPDADLSSLIECYWIAEDTANEPIQKKIIPDGFSEIIFHFGDPYRIRLQNTWERQSKRLLAGQISKHFYLENTGVSSILGIKMKPTSLAKMYPLIMQDLTDAVVDIGSVLGEEILEVERELRSTTDNMDRIGVLNDYFKKRWVGKAPVGTPVDRAVEWIAEHHGMMPVAAMSASVGVGERQLENLFRRYVGLSPKLFARIIRFNYIFELVQQNDQSWCDLAYEAAFYDQSHFIRNFRNFTGENPAQYAFDEKNMANFFLNRK